MNRIENAIYNDGVLIKTDYFYTADGDQIKDEYILYANLIYCFTFYEGELTNCRRV